ncbi:5-deoxy-glucuronate isomerase [Photobacterium nomapromontoriensis]|uniref:5-deoxy-glucuronate isomerase n=1 Tax=Photobacterium nomapromontoriensis TaxID=2910237 RepID=UPI003D099BDD
MSKLLSKYSAPDPVGNTQAITPESAGWEYVGFNVFELEVGQRLTLSESSNERCLVLIGGFATVSTSEKSFENIGDRMSPFERKKPYAVFMAKGEAVTVVANTTLELAVCEAPGWGTYPTRLITPDDIDAEQRGTGNNQRYVHNILPDYKEADSLLVVEVYTDEGCTSSYPSHKHDQDAEPNETYLEETYYHRLNPPQGFCLQRVYTDDRSLDECMAVYDKDVVKVPKGYHPVATVAGYDNYYLNVMAGPVRKWLFTWEGDHQWVNENSYVNKHASK